MIDLFDQLPVGAFQVSADLERIRINRRLAEYLGLTPGILSWDEALRVPEVAALAAQWLAEVEPVLKSGEPAVADFKFGTGEDTRHISMRLGPLRDETGRITGLVGIAADVSDIERVARDLRSAESRFQTFMDHLPLCTWVKDEQGRHQFINRVYAERFNVRNWAGKRDEELWPPELAQRFRESDQQVLANGQSLDYEQSVTEPDGEKGHWWVHKFQFRDGNGRQLTGGVALDVSDRRDLETRLRESEARFQAFLDHSPALAWMKDEEGRYLFMSRSYIEFLGLGQEGWRGLTDFQLYPAAFAQRARDQEMEVLTLGRAQEFIGAAPDVRGRQREWLMVRFPISDGTGRRFIGCVATDITERRRAEEHVRLQSLTDDLTGLYNRRGFWLLADQEYRLACRRQMPCAILLLDMDGLKRINDQQGHEAGDRTLVALAEALRVATRNSDIIGRIGGDEFVVFAADCNDAGALQARLYEVIEESNRHDPQRVPIAVSVGILDFVADAASPLDSLVAEADSRMYRAKRERFSRTGT